MKAVTKDKKIVDIPCSVIKKENYISVSISKNYDYKNINTVELDYWSDLGNTNDNGYIMLPRGIGNDDYSIMYMNMHHVDFKKEIKESNIPVFGLKSDSNSFLAVVSGMTYDYTLNVELKSNKYYVYPVFNIYGEQPYEDLKIDFYILNDDDADYSGMARKYRDIKLRQGIVFPLKDRMKYSDSLRYSSESVMIRIRCGWKPAPPEILHQTLDNEPPMHIACSFDRVCDIIDEMHKSGIKKAEICLVGWNVKGHDGRWPQAFPVCEELGGEKKLKNLIEKAKEKGYVITCHTNSTDQYEIADNYDAENTRLDINGKAVINDMAWSGGQMFDLCPEAALKQAEELLPEVAELGFKGTHYIDVLGVAHPRRCYNKNHYVNSKRAVECAWEIAKLSKKVFGGFSSEGAYDYLCPYLDYGLYISGAGEDSEIIDKSIPFWQLVYHGIILSNPYAYTMNPTFKDKKVMLKVIEYGGRPSYYFYSAFMGDGENWMGSIDARCSNDEELRNAVSSIKSGYAEYMKLSDIVTSFMDKHEEISKNVYEITYSNGYKVIVDYNKEEYRII